MSNPEPNPQVEELLKKGIDAARSGDKTTARALLEQVVELDQQNEKGWFWLAAVVDDADEKRVCLGNVVVINPDNKRAQRLLAQLEGSVVSGAADDRAALLTQTGVNRRVVYLAIGLGVVAVIALIVVLAVVLGGNGDSDKTPPPTLAALGQMPSTEAAPPPPGETRSPAPASTTDLTSVPATALASVTPTNRPATWTPVPSSTPVPESPPTLFPPPPTTPAGQIVMRSGLVAGDPDNQPIVLLKPDGSSQRPIMSDGSRGHTPVLSPDGSQVAYIKYAPGTQEFLLELNNTQGTAPRSGSGYWAGIPTLYDQDQPDWSLDGQWIAFVAKSGSVTPDLYRVSLANPNGSPDALERLTNDDAIESWPSFSPDSRRIVYAADLSKLEFNSPTELRIIDTTTGAITNLTQNGPDLIESAPDWSPDGQRIVFQAREASSQENDIYWMPASGLGEPEKIIDSPSDDIRPRFSPDGRYIVFSSNRTGNWDVFIYEIATQALYQITWAPYTDIANDWGR